MSPQDSYSPLVSGQEEWCKGPLVMGSAAGWRRLGEGLSAGRMLAGGDRRDAVEGKGSQVLCE